MLLKQPDKQELTKELTRSPPGGSHEMKLATYSPAFNSMVSWRR
jgi:hypothetical protein